MEFLTAKISPQRATYVISRISNSEFFVLQGIFLVAGIIPMLLIFIHFNFFSNKIVKCLKTIINNMTVSFKDFVKTDGKYLIFIPISMTIFCSIAFPVNIDEAFTYTSFTVKSPLTIITSYPAPNNHILYSLLTKLTSYISFFSPLFSLRLPNLVVHFITYILVFSIIKRIYNEKSAVLIVGIYSTLFMSIYFSYLSRGYGLINLFFIITFFSVYKILVQNTSLKHWVIFSIFSVLGFYTMPSFLYPFLALNAIIFLNNYRLYLQQIIFNILILFTVFLLYSPIIIFEGLDAIINNEYVKPIPREIVLSELPGFFSKAINEIFGLNFVVFIIIILSISISNLIILKQKFEIISSLVFCLLPFIILGIHSVIPFSRTFNYYAFIFVFIPIISFTKQLQMISKKNILMLVIFLQIILSINFFHKIRSYERIDFAFNAINKEIIGNNSYFLYCNHYPINFLYEIKSGDYKMAKYRYVWPIDKMISADTIFSYDYIIIDKDKDLTRIKFTKLSNEYVNVY